MILCKGCLRPIDWDEPIYSDPASLSPFEIQVAYNLGKMVVKNNVKLQNKDRQRREEDPVEVQAQGFAGELAFCKLANVYPDLAVGTWKHYDCVLRDGRTVDVKTMSFDTPDTKILVPSWAKEKPHPDLYACIVGSIPEFRFAGLFKSSLIFQKNNLCDLGRGENYGVLVNV